MWSLYIFMAILCAGVVIKLVHPLTGRGHGTGERVGREDRFLVAVLVVLIPAVSLAFYLMTGRPDLRGQQAIFDMTTDLSARQAALLAARPMSILLEKNPDDIGAHVNLASIHTKIGNDDEAVKFLTRAVELAAAQNDEFLRLYAVELGQAQIRVNKGIVGDDALKTFAMVRTLYPQSPLARHYEALAKAQRGDVDVAIAEWLTLLNEGPTRAYWKEMVRQELSAARTQQRRGIQTD